MVITKNKDKEKISILLDDLASLENYIGDLFSFLPVPICLVSAIGIILEINSAFKKISDYKTEEIVGIPVENIFSKKEIAEISKNTLEKGFVEAEEATFFTKGKKKILVSVFTRLRKSEEGEITGYFISLFDLTNIKKIEETLREKIEELEIFHKLAVGRELKMIALKEKIEELKKYIK